MSVVISERRGRCHVGCKLVMCLLLQAVMSAAAVAQSANPLQLTLPPTIYAVPGIEHSLYFDNIVLTQTPEAYRFQVVCELGTTAQRRWTCTPTADDVGTVPLTVRVTSDSGELLGEATSTLRIVPAKAGRDKKIRLLIVGDSLTNATAYPNRIADLLQQPNNPKWTMLGTHRPASAASGVAHEGYGGWTWARFATHYEPNPDPAQRKFSSPFVFVDDNQAPQLNVAKYLQEHCDGQAPDYVIFLLGINDCFGAPPDDPAGMDARISTMLQHADTFLADFRKAAPNAHFGICLTPAANARQAAFAANYGDRYSRWGWKRIQHRVVQRQLQHFADSPEQNRSLIPTQLNIDPVDGYPENNGVHPNQAGYNQIGDCIYAWLKSRL